MAIVYFDCFSGASGDMILGALLDAGVQQEVVRAALESLSLPGWTLDIARVQKGGLSALKVTVDAREGKPPRRGPADIERIIEAAPLAEGVKARARDTFHLLADAEAKVHGVPTSEIHFHEVGGIDAIVDIVGASAALEHLHPLLVVTSPITTGRGSIESAHGIIPVPAPAVVELLRGARFVQEGDQELITPTGAAILAAATDRFDRIPPMRLTGSGYGAGTRERETPNVLRVLIGEETEATEDGGRNGSMLIETNIDDMSPELIPYALERLLAEGASDAWVTPIVMKKGRPAAMLSVLVKRTDLNGVLDVVYRETTTFGVRIREVDKDELQREHVTVHVSGHPVRVKVGSRQGRVVTASPEYEDASKVARITGLPLKDIFREAQARYSESAEREPPSG
jgi:uncharacterized protein (TIGR00299 family) protein